MLPDVRRLNKEDLQDAPNWIDPMLNVLNAFMDSVYNIMKRNVSLTENANFQLSTIPVSVKSDGTIDPIKVKATVRGRVLGIIPLKVQKESTDTSTIQAPFFEFSQAENILTITNIAGLNSSKNYKIIVLITGE